MSAMQPEFFQMVTNGVACDAASLMARIALNLGYDSAEFPVDISEMLSIALLPRDPGTVGFNELMIIDYIRSALVGSAEPWSDEEVAELIRVAGGSATGKACGY